MSWPDSQPLKNRVCLAHLTFSPSNKAQRIITARQKNYQNISMRIYIKILGTCFPQSCINTKNRGYDKACSKDYMIYLLKNYTQIFLQIPQTAASRPVVYQKVRKKEFLFVPTSPAGVYITLNSCKSNSRWLCITDIILSRTVSHTNLRLFYSVHSSRWNTTRAAVDRQ